MTDSDTRDGSQDALAAPQENGRASPRRPRTAYLWYRRYLWLGRVALLLGGCCGLLVTGYALLPLLLAGEPVPRSSFLVAIAVVAVAALLPYAVVRWRWRALRDRLDED